MMKLEEFELSLAVSAVLIALLMLTGAGGGISPLFAVALFAGSQAGFFGLQALKKSGTKSPNAEFIYVAVIFACFFIAAFSLSAFSAVVPFLFAPLALASPAIGGIARGMISG